MSSENYFNLRFDEEQIRMTVLTNIARMFVRRGHMDFNKYKATEKKTKTKSRVVHPENDIFDNDKFLPLVENKSDENIYVFPMDFPIQESGKHNKKEKSSFDGSKLIIKIFNLEIKDLTNNTAVNEFMKSHPNNHKLIVFDKMTDKVYRSVRREKNIEVFEQPSLMIDLMSHEIAPIECEIIERKNIDHVKNPKFGKICENDPVAMYYYAKEGSFLRSLIPSMNNSLEVHINNVIEPKPYF
jgi:hypothetical protein